MLKLPLPIGFRIFFQILGSKINSAKNWIFEKVQFDCTFSPFGKYFGNFSKIISEKNIFEKYSSTVLFPPLANTWKNFSKINPGKFLGKISPSHGRYHVREIDWDGSLKNNFFKLNFKDP